MDDPVTTTAATTEGNAMPSEKTEGLLRKYDVKRVNDPDGKHAECRFFVLDPQHDPIARAALAAYAAEAAAHGYEALAADLRAWIGATPTPTTDAAYTDTYALDTNGNGAAVSRPFIRVRADEVLSGDLLILDSGLSRVTHVDVYTLPNRVEVFHITGPTNVVRATYETVTVLRNGT